MSFLDTEPAVIHRPGGGPAWAPFRIGDPRARHALLRALCSGAAPLTLGVAGGATVAATLWAIDELQQCLHFSSPAGAVALRALAAQPAPWAAGYLQDVKLQFELRALALGAGTPGATFQAGLPQQMYRLPRRQDLRVKHAGDVSATVQYRHPLASEHLVRLELLDVSLRGCAFRLPHDGLPLVRDMEIPEALVQLGEAACVRAGLRVRHLTHARGLHGGARVGCAWQGLAPAGAEALQAWIGGGRRRRGLLSLSLD